MPLPVLQWFNYILVKAARRIPIPAIPFDLEDMRS